jgi:hypothetical protein
MWRMFCCAAIVLAAFVAHSAQARSAVFDGSVIYRQGGQSL